MSGVHGLHHMTAICGDAQANLDFYTGFLGLRLLKVTVNFDDPNAYHLYYGDAVGTPGTVITFFPYPGGRRGRNGDGMAVVTDLAVPSTSLDYWRDRLGDAALPGEEGEPIEFSDPDGLLYRLVPDDANALVAPWPGSPVPVEHQIAGMRAVRLREREIEATAALLIRVMGFEHDEHDESDLYVFRGAGPGPFRGIEVELDGKGRGFGGPGTIHHVAFRTPDDETQARLREELTQVGASVSDVRDRDYFRSIYFREPGGVLFEIATEGPGFGTDEAELGTSLRLPAMHEPRRGEIETHLPPLRLPNGAWIGEPPVEEPEVPVESPS